MQSVVVVLNAPESSVPRLELLGVPIGLRLTRQVCSALKTPTNGVTYRVDSVIVGYWIQGLSREYNPFIAHRVGEIHSSLLLISGAMFLLM